MKPLRIGIIGYGFMGRTHSNAYKRVNDFFDLAYRPVLKAVCGRTAEGAKAFADKWQYESFETDWRKLIAHCRRQLAHFKTPRYWKFVESFPMTVTGKVQKYRMREIATAELGLNGDVFG